MTIANLLLMMMMFAGSKSAHRFFRFHLNLLVSLRHSKLKVRFLGNTTSHSFSTVEWQQRLGLYRTLSRTQLRSRRKRSALYTRVRLDCINVFVCEWLCCGDMVAAAEWHCYMFHQQMSQCLWLCYF